MQSKGSLADRQFPAEGALRGDGPGRRGLFGGHVVRAGMDRKARVSSLKPTVLLPVALTPFAGRA
jgi:hypothetical protein